MAAKQKQEPSKLIVPLDASGIDGIEPDSEVKVLVIDGEGATQSECVRLDKKGAGSATFNFPRNPGSSRIVVGPADASDVELGGLQTLSVNLTARRWAGQPELRITPIVISSYYWYWWRRWCRTFTIRGVVLCPDGSPVPGAKVCACDVDWWWWWSSNQQVGCATTDAFGAFEIKFRWCCGWWPWWWWRGRFWQLEPQLIDRITPVLKLDPTLPKLATPSPQPSLELFESIVAENGVATGRYAGEVDPANLDALQRQLVTRLPAAPDLGQLRIWPWYQWHPWWDCTPDIIFKVSQECEQGVVQIINEGFSDARWNIPESLSVVLVASDEACCIPGGEPCIDEECIVLTSVCDDIVDSIGGNVGAPAAPAGYKNPGAVAVHGDRPYGGRVSISGTVDCMDGVDYYEFEWTQTPANAASWAAMPPAAAGDFSRRYIELSTLTFPSVTFSASPPIDGRHVYESLEHYEAGHPPADWGSNRIWIANWNQLTNWLTQNNFADGTYYLRMKGWDLVGTNLVNPRVLALCGQGGNVDNQIVVTIDNRVVGAGPTDASGHPCGTGTVHVCTDEPDTGILSVQLIHTDGTPATPIETCGEVQINDTDILEIEFMAHDPDGHLAYYTLDATYGTNLLVPLVHTGYPPSLGLPGGDVLDSAVSASLTAGSGIQVGPRYGYSNPLRSALDQGAISPHWHGGVFRFSVRAIDAFPATCCYQLELRAYKRTIHDCNDNYPHRNRSESSFAIVLP